MMVETSWSEIIVKASDENIHELHLIWLTNHTFYIRYHEHNQKLK